jgi:hypothetical protein
MKIRPPYTGLLAFLTVLFTMPLGHAAMILMEKGFGHHYIYHAALLLGFIGILLLIWGIFLTDGNKATFLGLFGGLFVWTGWIEFAYVYYAHRYGVAPLVEHGEVVTKPEYLIMPSSVGFWAVAIMFYLFGTRSGCLFFNWIRKKLRLAGAQDISPAHRNAAMSTFMELILILWTFYLVLLFIYDKNFFGEKSVAAYLVAFGSLLWSAYLFMKLLKIPQMAYAIRYAVPTVIIFWNFVEILGRWGMLREIWIEPWNYWKELGIMALVFLMLVIITLREQKKKKGS